MTARKSPAALTHYLHMTRAQGDTALQEFLDEREPALARLRKALADDGPRPETLLDGSVESLVPLWRWMLSRFELRDAPGATDPASVPWESWPSWERHTYEEELTLSWKSLELLDGLVSYLAAVILEHAPAVRWDTARHPVRRYHLNNRPVLVGGAGEGHIFLPGLPTVDARAALKGVRESSDDAIAVWARQIIDHLNRAEAEPAEMTEPEPLFEVLDTSVEPGEYNLEINLGEEVSTALAQGQPVGPRTRPRGRRPRSHPGRPGNHPGPGAVVECSPARGLGLVAHLMDSGLLILPSAARHLDRFEREGPAALAPVRVFSG